MLVQLLRPSNTSCYSCDTDQHSIHTFMYMASAHSCVQHQQVWVYQCAYITQSSVTISVQCQEYRRTYPCTLILHTRCMEPDTSLAGMKATPNSQFSPKLQSSTSVATTTQLRQHSHRKPPINCTKLVRQAAAYIWLLGST